MGKKLYTIENEAGSYVFHCPGCNYAHKFDKRWSFNGSIEKPTFAPSLLVNGNKTVHNPAVPRCHSYVTNGMIQFLTDCDHALKGQKVEIPDIEE